MPPAATDWEVFTWPWLLLLPLLLVSLSLLNDTSCLIQWAPVFGESGCMYILFPGSSNKMRWGCYNIFRSSCNSWQCYQNNKARDSWTSSTYCIFIHISVHIVCCWRQPTLIWIKDSLKKKPSDAVLEKKKNPHWYTMCISVHLGNSVCYSATIATMFNANSKNILFFLDV